MAYIKRGEAKTVPVRVKFNDMDVFPIGNVDEIAFKLGDSVRKTWPDAVRYDNANDRFMLTLTQEDTLSLDVGQAELEITCNFKDGSDATVTAASIKGALGYTPAAPGDIPVVPTAEISANTGARHSHANKAVIDGITAAKTAAWDGKAGTAAATQSAAGLMSAADKAKLDGIERGANKTTVPTALKNPKALTIQIGGTTVTYDGSAAKTVTIADGTEVSY